MPICGDGKGLGSGCWTGPGLRGLNAEIFPLVASAGKRNITSINVEVIISSGKHNVQNDEVIISSGKHNVQNAKVIISSGKHNVQNAEVMMSALRSITSINYEVIMSAGRNTTSINFEMIVHWFTRLS